MADNNEVVVYTGSDKFAAFLTRFHDCAVVRIYAKPTKYEINFNDVRACYETANRGASASARKEVRRLEREAI